MQRQMRQDDRRGLPDWWPAGSDNWVAGDVSLVGTTDVIFIVGVL